ncbi:MAG: DNA-deoxyinosine glycosylase [Butyrivibrio sp.]|nr:DNA-deoxyinosine glycosylase [Butyrivibrio sp.]
MIVHPIEPIYYKDSKILILGSFPSVKSREEGFFYGHKQNRFWKVISGIFEEDEPKTIEEKKSLLLRNRIALWDVIQSCDIVGSSDSSISNVVPNDLSRILSAADIRAIFVNGKTALKYFNRYTEPLIKRPAICLPSTSPANAAWSLEKLLEVWKCRVIPFL